MTDHPKSRRARIIAGQVVPVTVGRGLVDYQPGWSGPVPAAVADYLETRPDLAEVWRDGEPPAPAAPGAPEDVTAVRIIQTEDGPRFEDMPPGEPPPLPDASAGFEGEEA